MRNLMWLSFLLASMGGAAEAQPLIYEPDDLPPPPEPDDLPPPTGFPAFMNAIDGILNQEPGVSPGLEACMRFDIRPEEQRSAAKICPLCGSLSLEKYCQDSGHHKRRLTF